MMSIRGDYMKKSEAIINLLVVALLIFGDLEIKQAIPVLLIGIINCVNMFRVEKSRVND